MKLTTADLARLAEALKVATPGPWGTEERSSGAVFEVKLFDRIEPDRTKGWSRPALSAWVGDATDLGRVRANGVVSGSAPDLLSDLLEMHRAVEELKREAAEARERESERGYQSARPLCDAIDALPSPKEG